MTTDSTCHIFECKYARTLNQLTEAETEALETSDLTSATIARILRANGHDVHERVVQRHRRQECGCS